MKTLNVNVPENLNELELKIILAGELYEREKITLGQAAELAGLTKRTFIEIMGKYGFSIFGSSTEDLMADIDNA
jgi:predicted HTH domain antitoxin